MPRVRVGCVPCAAAGLALHVRFADARLQPARARPYDGVDHVVMDDVPETMLDPGKSDPPVVAVGVVAEIPCDVIANLNLHRGLAEVEIAAVMQFKSHHFLHDPVKAPYRIDMPIRGEREVAKDRQCWAKFVPSVAGTLIQKLHHFVGFQ